mgnify:CR=1 FL=1
MDVEALRGLAEAYRQVSDLPGRAKTLQQLYRAESSVQAELIGIVEREIRSGYSGFIFLTGIAR